MDLPQPVTHDQMYLRAMHDLLVEQNALLADVRDRLPTPEQPVPADAGPAVAEPESEPQPESVEVALTEPAVPARTPAKKTTAAARRTAKKGG